MLLIGVARCDISPPEGIDLSGFVARDGPCTGTHDPLTATAIVATDGHDGVAITSCDLIGLGAAMVQRVRIGVERRTRIPAGAQMLACTHTHGGPETGVITTIGAADPAYLARLERTLVDVVAEASSAVAPAHVGWGRGECHAAFNRRQPPGIIWPIDPDVMVGRIAHRDGTPLATLLHYTCHPVAAGAANRLATADWCGVTRRLLEDQGTGPVLVMNGAAGDINPIMESRGYHAVEQTGRSVAEAALALWQRAVPKQTSGVSAASARCPVSFLPLPDDRARTILWQEWLAIRDREAPDSVTLRGAMVTHRNHVQKLARLIWGSDTLPTLLAETQVVRIGPIMVASLPGEFFSAFGREVKDATPGDPVMIAAWSNDNLGYFPTRGQYLYGGYEVDIAYRYYGYPAAWSPESGELVTAQAAALIQQVRRDSKERSG